MESHSGGLVGRSVGRFTTSATGIHALTDAATLTERCIRQINYISVQPLQGVGERFKNRDQCQHMCYSSVNMLSRKVGIIWRTFNSSHPQCSTRSVPFTRAPLQKDIMFPPRHLCPTTKGRKEGRWVARRRIFIKFISPSLARFPSLAGRHLSTMDGGML